MQIIRYLTDRSAIFKPARLTTSKGGLDAEMQLVKVYPDIEYQTILGFGAAITEASGYVFSHMSNEQKIEFALDCFGPGGNNYNLATFQIKAHPIKVIDTSADNSLIKRLRPGMSVLVEIE